MDHFCYLCFVFVMFSCLFIVGLWSPAGQRVDLLALLYVILYCVLSLSHVMSRVRCGARLYRLLIFCLLSYFHKVLSVRL